jgi:hypothetical protein
MLAVMSQRPTLDEFEAFHVAHHKARDPSDYARAVQHDSAHFRHDTL